MSRFSDATTVEQLGEGSYGVHIDRDWFVGPGPNGGYLAAIVLRALRAHVDEADRHPLSLTCHFLAPAGEGPAIVDVRTERVGRGVTALSARLHQDQTILLALATFGVEREGMIDYETHAPGVPAAEVLRSAPAPAGWTPPIFHQIDYRHAMGHPLLSGSDEALVGGWISLRDGGELDESTLAMFADAWPPAAWARVTRPAQAPTIDMTFHFRSRIEPGTKWALVRMTSTTSKHGFMEEDGEVWAPDGTLLMQTRQLALLRPVVYE